MGGGGWGGGEGYALRLRTISLHHQSASSSCSAESGRKRARRLAGCRVHDVIKAASCDFMLFSSYLRIISIIL